MTAWRCGWLIINDDMVCFYTMCYQCKKTHIDDKYTCKLAIDYIYWQRPDAPVIGFPEFVNARYTLDGKFTPIDRELYEKVRFFTEDLCLSQIGTDYSPSVDVDYIVSVRAYAPSSSCPADSESAT